MRGNLKTVNIEFSIPKLIFLNNLDELSEKDFEKVIKTLHERLKEMEIFVEKQRLKTAEVSAIHFGKNIILKDYSANYIISELEKININKHFDLTKTRFMNSGESLQYYTASNSITFYDKKSDLNKDEKRAIDRDQTEYQKSLFNLLDEKQDILRFEVRLSQKRKMKSIFKKIGFKQKQYLFREVFSEDLAVKVMMDYWNSTIDKNKYVLFTLNEPAEKVLKQISVIRPKAKAKTLIYLSGLIYLIKGTKGGLREIRKVINSRTDDRTWYRMVKDLREISKDLEGMSEFDWYKDIVNQIKNYKKYKVSKKEYETKKER